MPPRIFISYRRDDAAGEAGRLSDHLIKRFGPTSVFLDIDTIAPGTDFVVALQDSLQQTGAMLVIIGRRWIADGSGGLRRLDDPRDFVRLELETALARGTPIVPVLVQGAVMPKATELPHSLERFTTRQALRVDHDEFRDDVERLCDHVARILGEPTAMPVPFWRTRIAAGAAAALLVLLLAGGAYWTTRESTVETDDLRNIGTAETTTTGDSTTTVPDPATTTPPDPRIDAALAEAAAQQRRNQYPEALTTLAAARQLAPDSAAVRRMQEDVAMNLIRDVRVREGGTFGEAIKPGLAVVDAALPAATGARRADLLAHSGWATFLMWRDGDKRLDPTEWYRDALKTDPDNPYANAMLAHWMISQRDDVAGGTPLFITAEADRRAIEAVRQLEWGAFSNSSTAEADVERVRLADRMRVAGEHLNERQQSALHNGYYRLSLSGRDERHDALLKALPPDEHLALLAWAYGEDAKGAPAQNQLIRWYESLLHAEAGRTQVAIDGLVRLRDELGGRPGSLQDAVTASLRTLRTERREGTATARPRSRPQ